MSLQLSDYSVHLQGILSRGIESIDLDNRRFGFSIGKLGLLSDPQRTSELIQAPAIAAVPNSPAWFRGMVVNRGAMMPVFDLQALFDSCEPTGSNEPLTPTDYILAVSQGTEYCALCIDNLPVSVRHTEDLTTSKRLPDLPDFIRPALTDFYDYQSKVWCEVDYTNLFETVSAYLASQMQQAWNTEQVNMITSTEGVLSEDGHFSEDNDDEIDAILDESIDKLDFAIGN